MGYKEKWNPVFVCILGVGFIETFMSPYFELVFFLGFMLKKNSQIFVHFFMGYKEKVTFFFVCIFYRLVYKRNIHIPLFLEFLLGFMLKKNSQIFYFLWAIKKNGTSFLFIFYGLINKNIHNFFNCFY